MRLLKIRNFKKYIYIFLLAVLCLFTCTNEEYQTNIPNADILEIPIVFHVRNENDVNYRIPKYWNEMSEPLFQSGRIRPIISEIRFDVPDVEPDIDNKDSRNKFYKMSKDGRIHIFFVDDIFHSNYGKTIYHGIYKYKSMCNSYIIIQDNSDEKTIAHEIGHYLGLDHCMDAHNVMNDSMANGIRNPEAGFTNSQFEFMRKNIREQQFFCKMPKKAN